MQQIYVMDLVLVATQAEANYLPSDIRLEITGIGLVPAAIAATRAILAERPKRVVNLGSVGSLDPKISGIVHPSAVFNRDVNAEELRAAGIAKADDVIALGGDGPVLGSGDSFVAGGAAREALLGRCQIVDMEGYAIAAACRALDVELVMIKHVSDAADAAALSWASLVDASARALAKAYEKLR